MNALLELPLVLPLATAAATLLAWRQRRIQRWVSAAGAFALLVASLMLLRGVWDGAIIAGGVGGWRAPFGIVLVADAFGALMVTLTAIMGLATVVYSFEAVDGHREAFGFFPLLHLLLLGCCGTFLTGDLFNLFVWFEVMLISTFALLALGGDRVQLEGALKYMALNLLASFLLLAGVGLIYAATGTLNLADLSTRLDSAAAGARTAYAMLLLVAFGIKAAVFPLFFWLPPAYGTPPIALSAFLAGIGTKVGVYAMIRVFTLLFADDPFLQVLLLWVAGLTMVIGVLGAVAQFEIRRLLAFHVVSQIGYLIMGLALLTRISLLGAVYFMAHIVLAKSALFLVAGVAGRIGGSFELKRLAGLATASPVLAALFLVPAFSMAGVPPFSGFFGKLALVQAGLATERYALVAAALGVGVLTLYSMVKIWTFAFWEPAAAAAIRPPPRLGPALLAPIAVLAASMVVLGVVAQPVLEFAGRAADQLLDPAAYARAVLP